MSLYEFTRSDDNIIRSSLYVLKIYVTEIYLKSKFNIRLSSPKMYVLLNYILVKYSISQLKKKKTFIIIKKKSVGNTSAPSIVMVLFGIILSTRRNLISFLVRNHQSDIGSTYLGPIRVRRIIIIITL